jgi:cysteine desulfurase
VIQPIPQLVERIHGAGALFHTDAVQAVGKIRVELEAVPADFLSLSGHKLHGPLGVGALVARNAKLLAPLVFGGSQENSLRPGTENVPGIVGLGVALSLRHDRLDDVAAVTLRMRDFFESRLAQRGLVRTFNGARANRLPNTSSVQFGDIDGEALSIRLDQMSVRCSQSSACTNQRPEPSYVLRAMGLSESEAYASVRFGFSELNTMMEVNHAIEAIARIHASLIRFAVA